MNKLLFLVASVATVLLCVCGLRLHSLEREKSRLESNQRALLGEVHTYQTKTNHWAASVESLELEISELRQARSDDAKRIKELNIRLRRAESIAKSATLHQQSATLPLRDTVIIHDTVQLFSSVDSHNILHGTIRNDSISYIMQSVDTLYQVVHRIPRRFLFFRFGTKAIHQDVWSSNPNTKIVYTEYIELKKGGKSSKRGRRR